MRVPLSLARAFEGPFETTFTEFLSNEGYLPEGETLQSDRFLNRSVVPHLLKLSDLFNRKTEESSARPAPGTKSQGPQGKKSTISPTSEDRSIAAYWGSGSNTKNLRLAYLLAFMPPHLFRVAAVWAELSRLGFTWPKGLPFRGVEFGAGPATGAAGIAAGEAYAPVGLPLVGDWALIEQDPVFLELGGRWLTAFSEAVGAPAYGSREFKRKIDDLLLPERAPQFTLMLMSFFLNELPLDARGLKTLLLPAIEKHLAEEGILIIIEPALKRESRKILELRSLLLQDHRFMKSGAQILLPCLGHQACGAFAAPEDWCHEEVTWWRPPYLRKLEQKTGLDRKSLPFSYLVITKSKRRLDQILPVLGASKSESTYRLVSPSLSVHGTHKKEHEFYLCGQEGKRKSRLRSPHPPERGDVLGNAILRGDDDSTRVEECDILTAPGPDDIDAESV